MKLSMSLQPFYQLIIKTILRPHPIIHTFIKQIHIKRHRIFHKTYILNWRNPISLLFWLSEHNFYETVDRHMPDNLQGGGFSDFDYWEVANWNSPI